MPAKPQAPLPPTFVSTGHLPPAETVAALVEEAHRRFSPGTEGGNSQVYPALARAPRDQFGLCVAGVNGGLHAAGDAGVEFTIMSVSKPFVFALVCDALGAEVVRRRVGVNATGRPFNALEALDQSPDGRTNPMVNPGAIAATSLVPGATDAERWDFIRRGLERFAGRPLELDDEVTACAMATNVRNQEIALRLHARGGLALDAADAVSLYTRQCCLRVSARDLAVMGATMADGGVNPFTHEAVISPEAAHCALAVMLTAGFYENSGDWLFDVGLPGKSGISGGIVTVSPGKGALGTFAPPLDGAGNSIKGQRAARFLSRELGLDLLVSRPAAPLV